MIWNKNNGIEPEGENKTQTSLQRRKMFKQGYQFWLGIAAVFLIMGAGAWLYSSQFATQELLFLTKETVLADTLSDGSVVVLNKRSLLRYPAKFRGAQRRVWLTKGEAFFTVAGDKTGPFIVHSGSTVIQSTKSSFNVKNKKGIVEVIVETGTVQVSKNSKMITLRPGEKVLVRQSSSQLIKEINPDHLYQYYLP
ncbi:ferric-dicitrate binding protein FerR (iron transport regulator) [Pedobacter cryoconitis]|uniref:Ferric-dicitrate binding protein FerR (Iron transport regulator) n=1 Tax=Pedobacter cryoconitis TaxID=188932 RepID=A0A7W8ZNL5_9SPHI|nr:FecR domain-containing protein [Pedobacter cryoconitis]MBB5637351.1 ferric-dicitrate binding protein FerR (iron transport regulator) [Pedobacter cryoconitis]